MWPSLDLDLTDSKSDESGLVLGDKVLSQRLDVPGLGELEFSEADIVQQSSRRFDNLKALSDLYREPRSCAFRPKLPAYHGTGWGFCSES